MVLKRQFRSDSFATFFALKHDAIMDSHVTIIMRFLVVSFATFGAAVAVLPSVHLHVPRQTRTGREILAAQTAAEVSSR